MSPHIRVSNNSLDVSRGRKVKALRGCGDLSVRADDLDSESDLQGDAQARYLITKCCTLDPAQAGLRDPHLEACWRGYALWISVPARPATEERELIAAVSRGTLIVPETLCFKTPSLLARAKHAVVRDFTVGGLLASSAFEEATAA